MGEKDVGTDSTIGDAAQDHTLTGPRSPALYTPDSQQEDKEYLLRGTTLGRYLIVGKLGAGGMGIVYSAFDPDLDRKVALKVLRTSRDSAARTRLLREAQAMAKLAHPNVVTVFEVGSDAGRDFVAMEFVDGQDLNSWQKGAHEAEEILAVYRQAGHGLAAAHRAGLVHRDFKPHNILIDKEGRVQVTDFGLARLEFPSPSEQPTANAQQNSSHPDPALTSTGAIMGTPAYMAPEQHLANPADTRSDQFSFCVALYEALARQRPYTADRLADLKVLVTEQAANPLPETVQVSASIRAAIAKGMSREPELRHASMDRLLAILEEIPQTGKWPTRFAILALIIGSISLVWALTASQNSANQCAGDPELLRNIWDTDVQAGLRSAFTSTSVQGADVVYTKFAQVADKYASDIVDMRTAICRDGRGRGAQTDEVILLRMGCLQKRRRELGALTTAFASVDASGIDQVVEAALGMTSISECADTTALQRGVPRPNADVREEVEALQASLQEAESLGKAGHVKQAIVRTEAVQQRSLAIGYLPLQAESHTVLGRLYTLDLRIHDAEVAFEEAVLAAEECGYTAYRAQALVGLTRLVADNSSRYKEARRYARRAHAAIAQMGGHAKLTVGVDLALAKILTEEGRNEEALAMLNTRLNSYSQHPEVDNVQLARLQHQAVNLQLVTGEIEQAHALARSSFELSREELGESNPTTMMYMFLLSETLRALGNFEEAHTLELALYAYWSSEKGQDIVRQDQSYVASTRTIRGTVVDASGAPILGAVVVCSHKIFSDSLYLDSRMRRKAAQDRYQRVETDASGRFICDVATTEALFLIADHPTLGRSTEIAIAAGQADIEETQVLTVRPTGSLEGQINDIQTSGLRPVLLATTGLSAANGLQYAVTAYVTPEGRYEIARLAPGKYQVVYGTGFGSQRDMQSQEVTIGPNQSTTLDFESRIGTATLDVAIYGVNGAVIPTTQIAMVGGHHDWKVVNALNNAVLEKGLPIKVILAVSGETGKFTQLTAGDYTLCAIPIAVDFRDPESMRQYTEDAIKKVPTYCQPITLAPGQKESLSIDVPAAHPFINPTISPGPNKIRER